MATIHHHPFNPSSVTLAPGESAGYTHGPDDRYHNATVYVTAVPNVWRYLPGEPARTLAVPEVRISAYRAGVDKVNYYLDFTVFNRGPTIVHSYDMNITIIQP
jgi:hypothetical protein